ncbi:aspartate/glutamate racemase family protein [Paenibacillus sp. EPM92]|uniref:maleate cis-trans isomerase family protein n=1 Tax=Paenibacillus sp. EPM92 TaxID=1561195 RepID=UPI0019159C73|nr:aspartate/glutamate racemase family protein [Paenibacillus sp. EPM92]
MEIFDWEGGILIQVRNKKAGIIVPSSNTVLEPIVNRISQIVRLDVHYTRISVSQVDVSDQSKNQFALSQFLQAARLLAEAEVDVIAWGGTSGGWLGQQWDQHLCNMIFEETGIPSITATWALISAFQAYQCKKIGLFVPYIESLVEPIMKNFSEAGFPVTSEVHLNLTANTSIAQIDGAVIRASLAELSRGCEAVSAFCTNLAAAIYVEEIEKQCNVIIFDSVLLLMWALCQSAGIRDSISGWGRLLYENPPLPDTNS